ncbi:MAG TPA: GFA family protein [Gaiellaceae bacterium]|nr:GFA family protein [Gaiellaceae bacterium]
MSRLHGSCQCGGVAFAVSEPFTTLSFCHCATCKKISGGVGTANGRVRTGAIRITRGDDLVRTYQPDEGSAKTFCSVCGSNLFGGGWPESERTSVRLSAIDSEFADRPEAHIYVRSVAPWETLPDDGLQRHEAERSS